MGILDDMGVSKSSAKVILKVNYSFKYVSTLFKIILTSNIILRIPEL